MERPLKEERANCATHAFGIMLSLLGSIALLTQAFQQPDTTIQLNCVIYAASLLGVYTFSTLSHLFRDPGRRKLYRILDQAFIYLLIASTFSVVSVKFLHGFWWNVLLTCMWTVAISGTVSKLFFAHRVQTVSIWAYLLVGWMPVFGAFGYSDALPHGCLTAMVVGGIFYSFGTVFLFNDRRVWYFHAVWHLFVVAGSVSHFWAIYNHVVS